MCLTQKYLKTFLEYDPVTGLFTRTVSRGNQKKGSIAGCRRTVRGKSYRIIRIGDKNYFSHRLAFLYMTGSFPDPYTDHIDGDGENNAWGNLREVDASENQRNRKLDARNTTGQSGVHFDKSRSRYIAQIYINRKRTHIGSYENLSDAIAARRQAQKELGYHANHGASQQHSLT